MSYTSEHEALTRAAASVRATSSELRGTVSRHVLPKTTTFKDLHVLHETVKHVSGKTSNDFLTVLKNELVYSYANNYEKKINTRKRKSVIAVDDDVDKMMKGLPENIDLKQRTYARNLVVRLLQDLKGTQDENLVQSVMLSNQKLRSTDNDTRLVIASRLLSAVPIPLGKLVTVLGECWKDGAVTIDEDSEFLQSFTLPVSEEGNIAMKLGHSSLRFVTAVPMISTTTSEETQDSQHNR